MTRKEEIEKANPFYNIEPPTVMDSGIKYGFGIGAKWADEHPSEETIEKFFQLYNDWNILYSEGKTTDVGFDYVKKHWNDE